MIKEPSFIAQLGNLGLACLIMTVVVGAILYGLWCFWQSISWRWKHPRISGDLLSLEEHIDMIGSENEGKNLSCILLTMREIFKEGFDNDAELAKFIELQRKFQDKMDPEKKDLCYFIERNADHKWLTIDLQWTSNPLHAMRFNNHIRAYKFGCLFLNPLAFKVTEHLFVNEN
jgi:hypothetical protein